MADTKITDLTEATSVLGTDLLTEVYDPSSTKVNKKITVADFIATAPAKASYSAYGTGTNAPINNTTGLLTFGTTSPTITITAAGTYFVTAGLSQYFNNANFSTPRTATYKVRRSNNTATDLTETLVTNLLSTGGAMTMDAGGWSLPGAIYTTSNTNDVLEVWATLDGNPASGNFEAKKGWIVAIKL